MKKLPALRMLSFTLTLFLTIFCTQYASANPYPQLLSISGNSETNISISFTTPSVELAEVELDGQSFKQIDINSDAVIGTIGGPVLPGWSKWIELPMGMKPVLTLQESNCEIISDIRIAPFPISDPDNRDAASIEKPDRAIYSSNELIPAESASISDPITIGGKRFTVLTISPYQYNPKQEKLYVYKNLNVDISFENDPTVEHSSDRKIAPAMDELVRSLGDQPPQRDDGSLHQDNLGGYVIVTCDNDDIIEAIEPLAEWKRRKGFVVTMLNMDDVNGRVGLREYLIEARHEWDVPPTFVLLAGDGNGRYDIPYYSDGQQPMQSWHISDNQFVIWDYENPEGDRPEEWIPNAFIGRLPAEQVSEMEHIVAKILNYEIEPATDDPWVESAQLIAQGVRSCIHANVAVRELMQGFGYEEDNLHEAYNLYPQPINVNEVLNNINEGVGFINFRGYNNWGNISHNSISNLRNEWMLPVVTGMVCGSNDFIAAWNDSRPMSRGEAFIRAWPNNTGVGGVACFGPTDLNTHTWFNNTMDGEFYNSLFNRNVTYLGGLCVASKIRLISTYPSHLRLFSGQDVGYYFYTYTLLGDPGIQVRTREPISIEADFEENYPVGTTGLEVIVYNEEDEEAVEGAYVHIYNDDDTRFGAFTDDEGIAEINCTPFEEGEYLLTVSGQNLIPVLGEFEVTVTETFLALEEVAIDDDDNDDSDGNADGVMSPGETIEMNVTLKNSGSEDSDGANATLSCDSPWIEEITRNEVEYDAIASGETVAGSEPFVFNLTSETPDGAELIFELRIVSGDDEWKKDFIQTANGYDFTIVNYLFADTLLTPGTEQELTIELENTGDINGLELNATLFCDNRDVQIREAESFFEPMATGETAENNPDIPFEVFVSPNAYDGSEASFGLLLTDETGRSDSLVFTTLLGEPTQDAPQGPDGYGYWAFDNRDTTSGMEPEYEWVEGRSRVNNINDPNDQSHSSNHGVRVFHDLPFEFTYYGRDYEEITIGSNGWLCFGRTDQISWNNQGMGTGLAPPAMVAPFWTDIWTGQIYTWYDEDNARYIIEWRDWGSDQGNITFEVILYDPTVVNTVTGDGEIVFQYETLPNGFRDYPLEQATIGICSHNREDMLQITHARDWDERTGGLTSEMAIRFTTGEFMERGVVLGRVLDIVDESPIEDAWVRIDGTGFFDRTDEDGAFRIENIPVGSYTVVASMRHYNDSVAGEIEIIEDEETRVPDFELTHPTFNIDREEIVYGLRPDSSGQVEFNIWNEGNGPLDCTIEIDSRAEPPEERDEQWDFLFDYNLSDTARTGNWEVDDEDSSYAGDYNIKGVTFDGDYLYVAGAYIRGEQPHLIYVFNRDGERVRQFEQVSVVETPSTKGYYDLEFNGENLFGIEKDTVVEIDRDGQLIKSFYDPNSRTSSIAWSLEDRKIFTRSITGREIAEFDTSGGDPIIHDIQENGIRIYGLSWYPIDPDGFNLYLFVDNDTTDGENRMRIMKYNLETEELRHVTFLDYSNEYKLESCTITKLWNPLLWTFIGLASHGSGDRVFGVELGPNLTWINFDPDSASIPPHENQPVTISFFAEDMPERDYYILAKVLHNAVGDRHDLDVFFTIDSSWIDDAIDDDIVLPSDFTFLPPHPNPFNPSTRLSFTLPEPSSVELAVYDLTGRLVHEYDFGRLEVGRHQAMFNGSGLSSGIYFARLKAGSNTATQKMLLLK